MALRLEDLISGKRFPGLQPFQGLGIADAWAANARIKQQAEQQKALLEQRRMEMEQERQRHDEGMAFKRLQLKSEEARDALRNQRELKQLEAQEKERHQGVLKQRSGLQGEINKAIAAGDIETARMLGEQLRGIGGHFEETDEGRFNIDIDPEATAAREQQAREEAAAAGDEMGAAGIGYTGPDLEGEELRADPTTFEDRFSTALGYYESQRGETNEPTPLDPEVAEATGQPMPEPEPEPAPPVERFGPPVPPGHPLEKLSPTAGLQPGVPAGAKGEKAEAEVEDDPDGFYAELNRKAAEYGLDGDKIRRAILPGESKGKASAVNETSGAVGIIQILPSKLRARGIDPKEFAQRSRIDQLDVALDVLKETGLTAEDDEDLYYMAVAAPAYMRKGDDDTVIYHKGMDKPGNEPYAGNRKTWDRNKDGNITRGEILEYARMNRQKGPSPSSAKPEAPAKLDPLASLKPLVPAPKEDPLEGDVPGYVDAGAAMERNRRRAAPALKALEEAYPPGLAPAAESVGKAAGSLGLDAPATLKTFDSLMGGPTSAHNAETVAEQRTAEKPLTVPQRQALAEGGRRVMYRAADKSDITRIVKARPHYDKVLSQLADPKQASTAAFALIDLLGSRGAQSNTDLALVLGIDQLSAWDKIVAKVTQFFSGEWTEDRRDRLIGALMKAREADEKAFGNWSAEMQKQIEDEGQYSPDTQRGMQSAYDAIVTDEELRKLAQERYRAKGPPGEGKTAAATPSPAEDEENDDELLGELE